jgi:hypothetical protein
MLILLASSSWAPFLQTLVGAIFGALGAIAGGAFGTWFTWEKERQNLAAALAGEIHAINSLVEFRGFKEKLQSFISSSREAKKLSYHSRLVTQDYFVIFKRNADKIGHLPPDLARDVADFYVRAKVLKTGSPVCITLGELLDSPKRRPRLFRPGEERLA